MPNHVHILMSIPPRYSVAQVIGYIKGKTAIYTARNYSGRKRNFVGLHFWARGYFVSTVGQDEQVVREYIQDQEREDPRLDQLNLLYPPLGGSNKGCRLRQPAAALSGSQFESPRLCRGMVSLCPVHI